MTAPKPLPIPAPPMFAILATPPEAANVLAAVWQRRACFVCGKNVWCQHREPNVELAELEQQARRLRAVRV